MNDENKEMTKAENELNLSSVEAVIEHVRQIRQGIMISYAKLGRFIYEAKRRYPEIGERIAHELNIPKVLIEKLERIGDGSLDERIMYIENRSIQNALLRMPITDQQQALDVGIEVLLPNGDKKIVKVDDVDSAVKKQIVDKDRFRSLSQQKMYIEQQKAALEDEKREKVEMGWYWKGNKFIVTKPCEFTEGQIKKIITAHMLGA